MKNKNAIILCSGGLDSVVTAHYVKHKLKYKKLIILFFNYGQRTLVSERKCSKLTAAKLKAEFNMPFAKRRWCCPSLLLDQR